MTVATHCGRCACPSLAAAPTVVRVACAPGFPWLSIQSREASRAPSRFPPDDLLQAFRATRKNSHLVYGIRIREPPDAKPLKLRRAHRARAGISCFARDCAKELEIRKRSHLPLGEIASLPVGIAPDGNRIDGLGAQPAP